MDHAALSEHAARLRDLHHADRPLLLPNVWDAASARLVEGAGFPVVATSSGAVAAALGYEDADSMPSAEAFAAVGRIARSVGIPVTADMEAGYGLGAEGFVSQLLDAGSVGCNFEDTDHHGPDDYVSIDEQSERIAALRRSSEGAGVSIVINARVDVALRGDDFTTEGFNEAVNRAKSYLSAGADCVYPINLSDEKHIGEFVQRVAAPVNIWLRPDAPPLARLAELGVARVSMAGGLMRRAYGTLHEALAELASTHSTG